MSVRVNELEKEIIKLLSRRVMARWSDIKADLPDKEKKYEGTGFDVIMTRSLNRLIDRGYVEKQRYGSYPHERYSLTEKGTVLSWKINTGLRVDDLVRDQVLAFGIALQWIKNEAIIVAEKDDVHEYIARFKESLEALDIDRLVDDVKLYETMIENDEDPWDDANFIKYLRP